MDHRIGDKPAGDMFRDTRVAALARAACDGNAAEVHREIEKGADPNAKGVGGFTPLFWALDCKNRDGVESLLKAGADPNYFLPRQEGSPIPGGYSPLVRAATVPDTATLKLLLKYGGDPNAAETAPPYTALDRALFLGVNGQGWGNYYALLEAGADINREHAKSSIADRAAALGQFDKVVELLGQGYNHNLERLGGVAQARALYPPDPQIEWKAKVIVLLEQKGVRFPVIAEADKFASGEASLVNDGSLVVHWEGGHRGDQVVEPSNQVIKVGDPAYGKMMARIGGIKPGESKPVPRRPEDPAPDAWIPGKGRVRGPD